MISDRVLAKVNAIRATAKQPPLSRDELHVLIEQGRATQPANSNELGWFRAILGYDVATSNDGRRTHMLYNGHESTTALVVAIGKPASYWDRPEYPRGPQRYTGFAIELPAVIAELAHNNVAA